MSDDWQLSQGTVDFRNEERRAANAGPQDIRPQHTEQRLSESHQRRLENEARENCLGRIGDPAGVNVAKVEVSWYTETGLALYEEAGHYFVHATGNEPECRGEEGTIYAVFENLVDEAMEAKVEAGDFDGWAIDDISSA